MAEAKTHIRTTASKVGNGAHVLVPKDWLGKEILCVPADQLVALVANLHGNQGRAPPAQSTADGSLAYTRSPDGWQVLVMADRRTKTLRVWSAEHAWKAYQAKTLASQMVLEHQGEVLPVSSAQRGWLQAVLDAEGLAAGDLPKLDSADALKRIRRQLQVETDPARLRALAAELTRLLG
jgi:putative transposon-encoded protein